MLNKVYPYLYLKHINFDFFLILVWISLVVSSSSDHVSPSKGSFLSWRTMLCIFTVICCDSQWPMLYIHCYLSTPQALGSTLSLHSIPTLCPKEKQLSVACHQSFKRTIKFLYSLHTTLTLFFYRIILLSANCQNIYLTFALLLSGKPWTVQYVLQQVVSKLQLWPTLFNGCRCDRETLTWIKDGGFKMVQAKKTWVNWTPIMFSGSKSISLGWFVRVILWFVCSLLAGFAEKEQCTVKKTQ